MSYYLLAQAMESLFATAKAVVTAHPYASAVLGVLGAGYVAANYWKRKGPSGASTPALGTVLNVYIPAVVAV